jgi:cyanophycinase
MAKLMLSSHFDPFGHNTGHRNLTTTAPLKPLILLADGQLLFFKEQDRPYIRRLRQLFAPNQSMSAAYIGASNGDEVEYYDMFEMAMQSIGITNCMQVTSDLTAQQLNFVTSAQIILLSGGDIWRGWQTLSKIAPLIKAARNNGAVLIGTSAGAIQLGQLGWHDKPHLTNTDLFSTFGFIPAIFGAHDEQQNWRSLRQIVTQTNGTLPSLGIQTGAGLIVTPDNNVQAIRKPAISFSIKDQQLVEQPLWQLQLDV